MTTNSTQTTHRVSAKDIVVPVALAVPTTPIEPYVCPALRWSPQQKDRFLHDLQHFVDSLPSASNKHDRAIVAINFCIDARVDTASLLRSYLKLVGFKTGHISSLLKYGTGDMPDGNHWKCDKAGRYSIHPSAAAGIAVPAKRQLSA